MHIKGSPLLVLSMVIVIATLSSASVAYAEDAGPIQVNDVIQSDLNGDGKPEITIIDFSFVSGYSNPYPRYPYDAVFGIGRVYVYDQQGDMKISSNWEEATDFKNDIWLFDNGNDGSVELIIVFKIEDNHHVAYLYDDWDGDHKVAYEVSGTIVNILEAGGHWTAKATSGSAWRLANGQLNYNISFSLDGCIDPTRVNRAARGYRVCDDRLNGEKPDGKPEWEIEIVDQNHDASPEYLLGRIINPDVNVFEYEGSAGMEVNRTGRPSQEYSDQIFWPFLVTDHRNEGYNFFDYQPAVYMDWSKDQFYVGTTGYPIEAGYFINSFERWEKNQLNFVNFENPMAYYDLANDKDGSPELFIRLAATNPKDPWAIKQFPKWFTQVEVDWGFSQRRLDWDYKLALWGTYPLGVVKYPDFSLVGVSYEELPDWVMQKSWDLGIFIAKEKEKYISSEGIYMWNANTGYLNGKEIASPLPLYLMGLTISPPVDYYSDIEVGMRGEYNLELFSQPYFYFSSVDHKLHLLKAQTGIWKIDSARELHYENLGGDYLNQWELVENGDRSKGLYIASGFLIYADTSGVSVTQNDMQPTIFTSLPPSNHTEWVQLGKDLEKNKPAFQPDDLGAMFRQFSGPSFSLKGASMRGFRLTPDGFRFILELHPGFTFAGPDWMGLNGKSPGDYLVDFSNSFSITPLKPGQIKVELHPIIGSEPEVFKQIPIQVDLTNEGLEDKNNAFIIVEGHNGQETTQVISQTVALLSQTPIQLVANWQPTKDGEWNLVSRVEDQNGLELDETQISLFVKKGDIGLPGTIALATTNGLLYPILGILIVSALITSIIFSSAWSKNGVRIK